MKKAPKLTKDERNELQILHEKGYSARAIARVLSRSPNTIAAELKRNSYAAAGFRTAAAKHGTYAATYAQYRAWYRRMHATYQGKKIEEHVGLRNYIIAGLQAGWNPDEIAGAMRRTSQPFYASKTAIYEWLYSKWGQPYCQYLSSQRYRPKRRGPTKRTKVRIHGRISVRLRPLGATNRTRYGHWEGDTMVNTRTGSSTALAVFQERKTRLLRARLIPSLRATSFAEAARQSLLGCKALSLTLDNGPENCGHQLVTASLGTKTFFCDPYSSWQKGSIERTNGMLRQYLPKGSDLGRVDQQFVDAVCDRLNKKPRKILGYQSALQLAKEKRVLLPERATVLIEG